MVSIIKLVEEFLTYKDEKKAFLKKKKTEKRKEVHAKNKKKYKKLKNKNKEFDKESLSNSQVSSISHQIIIPKSKRFN